MIKNVFFTKDYVQGLKSSSDERLKLLVDNLLSLAEKAMQLPAYCEDVLTDIGGSNNANKNQHENYYLASVPFYTNMPLLGFGYYYTDDERYFEKARELMLTVAEYKKWCGKGWLESGGKGELITAHFCIGMAVGYAFFADKLTENERKEIVDSTYKLGILGELEDWLLPGTKIHSLDTMGHNWWSVCVSSAALAALVMQDEIPNGKELVKLSAEGLKEWFNYNGNPINAKPCNFDNGGYYESVSYFDYAVCEYLKFAIAYKKATGLRPFDDKELFEDAAKFLINTSYPSSKNSYFISFGDCGSTGTGVMASAYYLPSYGINSPELRWYMQNGINENSNALLNEDIALQVVLSYDEIFSSPAKEPNASSQVYEKIGWAIFRDSFSKDGTLLAVKCGDTWNHAHCDAGNFVLYRNGVPEIYDSCASEYSHPLYLNYFVTSNAHNILLYNDKGQDIRDFFNHTRTKGQLFNFTDLSGFKYICADATGPMSRYFRRHLRHFLWLDDFILIYDDVECYDEGKVSFLLHAQKNTSFTMLSECETEEHTGYLGQKGETEVTYLSFSRNTDKNGRVKFVSLIPLNNSISPELISLSDCYKIIFGKTTVYINLLSDGRIMHKNCINELEGIKTDAVMVIDKNGKYGTVNGSIIRKDGKSILDTIARITGWV